jgi:hypothetical protein
MILNCSTNRNPVYLNQVSVEARQLIHLHLSTDQVRVGNEAEMCGSTIMHEA